MNYSCIYLYIIITLSHIIMTPSAHACEFNDDIFTRENGPDYGLYWFNYFNECQRAYPNQDNDFFDPNKKTMIFIHGWQNDSTMNQFRRTFVEEEIIHESGILSTYWIDQGYNVGILYWNQFADESEVQDAEAKIWTSDGPRGMRWRYITNSGNVAYSELDTQESVSDLLYTQLKINLAHFQGQELRLLGHSLGSQLAIVLTHRLYESNSSTTPKPSRVALLEAFFSNGSKSYLDNDWTGERARNYVRELKSKGVIFESYRSSSTSSTIFVGDENEALLDMTAFSELRPRYFNFFQQSEKHTSAIWHYLWSMGFDAPPIRNTNQEGLSASTSNNAVRALMESNRRLRQRTGEYTRNPMDDEFILRRR